MTLHNLAARWPGADSPAFTGIGTHATTGEWVSVTGPSGSGKSTLLTVLLGQLAPDSGDYLLGSSRATSVGSADLRTHVAWCPQDAHLFRSSIRANLLLGRPRDEAPGDAEMYRVLRLVGLGDLVSAMPAGLDTSVGASGTALSGGERQRLAVARTLLSRAEVVLLDEPTAHLDAETARAMMLDLRMALDDRVVFLVSHRDQDARPEDLHISLGLRQSALV